MQNRFMVWLMLHNNFLRKLLHVPVISWTGLCKYCIIGTYHSLLMSRKRTRAPFVLFFAL